MERNLHIGKGTNSPRAVPAARASLAFLNELVFSTHAGSLIDLVKLDEDRTVIINFPLLFLQISLVQLVEPNRNLLPLLNIQLNDDLLSTFAINFQTLVHISRSVEADYCVLEMGEDILLLDFNLASSLLLVVIESIRTVWTYDRILILWTDIFQIEDLPIL